MGKLDTGDQAPNFRLFNEDAQPMTLGDLNGSCKILLLFFPGAFSTVCTRVLKAVNEDLPWYDEHNTNVAAISTDSTLVLSEFKRQNDFNFSLLSDHNAKVAEAYGCKYEGDFTHMKLSRVARRSVFLIGRHLAIRYARIYDDADEMPDLDTVKRIIKSLD